MNMKKCSNCEIEKSLDCFRKNKNQCKECCNLKQLIYNEKHKENILKYQKDYYQENKDEILESDKKHYQENKVEILARQTKYNQEHKEDRKVYDKDKKAEYNKIYYEEHKDDLLEYQHKYNSEHKEEIAEKDKKYRENNKEKISATKKAYNEKNKEERSKNNKSYRENNKDKISSNKKVYEKEKYDCDPEYKLRKNISRSIRLILKANGGSKAGKSVKNHLPHTVDEYIAHLEYHFSLPGNEWMNWDNWGVYIEKEWDDNDDKTWKWQLDHKKPHSDFHYTDMDCQEFRDCWTLSNLQPLSAKQNVIDGSTRIRHETKTSKGNKNK
jgi:hypothetical protein